MAYVPPWDTFFKESCIDLFTSSQRVIDIGEGLRARTTSGSRFDPDRAWLQPYLEQVTYQVVDPVPDYKPDIVGDIHDLPFKDNELDAILCLAVLEHVENPHQAMAEMHRTLKPGGKLLVYVPFLYYYHAHEGYYQDFWRFTTDSIAYLAKPFSQYQVIHVRDRLEMLVRLTPLGRSRFVCRLASRLDSWLDKQPKQQVGGFYVYLTK